jgi:hypothetical protein
MRAHKRLVHGAFAACLFVAVVTGSPLGVAVGADGPDRVRTAPLPATAWAGAGILGSIILVRAIRRRGH